MNERFEIEYKTLLTNPKAYDLLALGLFTYTGKQVNTYYDTKEQFFVDQRIVLRIREKNDTFLFTAKRETAEGLKETEFPLDTKDTEHPKIKEYLQTFGVESTLVSTGTTTTYRYTHNDQFGQWCLDFNVFPKFSDIELEYELKSGLFDKKDHFLSQLQRWDVPFNPCESKFIRKDKISKLD